MNVSDLFSVIPLCFLMFPFHSPGTTPPSPLISPGPISLLLPITFQPSNSRSICLLLVYLPLSLSLYIYTALYISRLASNTCFRLTWPVEFCTVSPFCLPLASPCTLSHSNSLFLFFRLTGTMVTSCLRWSSPWVGKSPDGRTLTPRTGQGLTREVNDSCNLFKHKDCRCVLYTFCVFGGGVCGSLFMSWKRY